MAGWRVGVLCGAKDRINEVLRFKSNMDSGMFLPVQLAAAKALTLGKEWYSSVNAVYRQRREKVYELLDKLGCNYSKEQSGMFMWAKVPAKYDPIAIADLAKSENFKTELVAHQQGKTNFLTFIKMCATYGIEKWAISMNKMTCTYYDKAGNEILVEEIPQ